MKVNNTTKEEVMSKILTLTAKSVKLEGKNKISINGKSFTLSKEILKASKDKNYDAFRVLVLDFIQNTLYKSFNVDSIKRKKYIRGALLNKHNQELAYRVDYKQKPKKVKKVISKKQKITVKKKVVTTKKKKAVAIK